MDDFDVAVMELMKEFSTTATYIKGSQGAYDPSTGQVVGSDVEVPVQAIMLDLQLRSNGLTTEKGTLIEAGDKELYVQPPNKKDPLAAALVVDPASDRVRVGSIEYKIVTFKELDTTGDNPRLFLLYIRR